MMTYRAISLPVPRCSRRASGARLSGAPRDAA